MRQASEWAVTQCLLIFSYCIAGSVSDFALIGLINETFFVIQGYEQFRQIVDLFSAFFPFGFV